MTPKTNTSREDNFKHDRKLQYLPQSNMLDSTRQVGKVIASEHIVCTFSFHPEAAWPFWQTLGSNIAWLHPNIAYKLWRLGLRKRSRLESK
jgi:hypothetical protein